MTILFSQIYDTKNLERHNYSNIKDTTLFLNISKNDKKVLFSHKGKKYLYYEEINETDIDIIYDCNLDLTKIIFLAGDIYCQQIFKGLFGIDSNLINLESILSKNFKKIDSNKINKNNFNDNINREVKNSVSHNNLGILNRKKLTARSFSESNLNETNNINNKVFVILTNVKLNSIASNINKYLKILGYKSKITNEFNKKNEKSNEIYIILFIKFFTELKNELPTKYIVYQMEQIRSNMFTKSYYKMLSSAYKIFEFSEANNFYLNQIKRNDLIINNFPLITENHNEDFEYDILFYGELNNRRLAILRKLQNDFNIIVRNDIFNEERDNLIKKSKIVLNLHYYHDACLETCRVNEVLKFNRLVISEEPIDRDNKNRNLYKNSVQYFDLIKSNLSNIEIAVNKIKYCLANYEKLIKNMDVKDIELVCKNQFTKNINTILYGDLQT